MSTALAGSCAPWCALDFPIDLPALLADLGSLGPDRWAEHTEASVDQKVRALTDVGATVVSLIAANGDPARRDPGLPGEVYAPTPVLSALPAFTALLDQLPGEHMAARLFRLAPNGVVKPHDDPFFGFAYGKLRLHVPLVTEPAVVMCFDGEPVHWESGRLWYGDFSRQHHVEHPGTTDRIHLIVDCVIDEGLLRLFPPDHRPDRPMVSRSPQSVAPALPVGRWTIVVARRALDWTRSEDPMLDEPMELTLTADPTTVTLRFPSGVEAPLRPVGGGDHRVADMPEELLVHISGERTSIIRRVGDDRTTFACEWKAGPWRA